MSLNSAERAWFDTEDGEVSIIGGWNRGPDIANSNSLLPVAFELGRYAVTLLAIPDGNYTVFQMTL